MSFGTLRALLGWSSIIKNRSITVKLIFFILSSCAVIFAIIFSYNYGVSRGIVIKKIEATARILLSGTVHHIETKILPAEKVPEYLSIAMEYSGVNKESIIDLIRGVLDKNPEIYGSAVAFEPYGVDKEKYFYSPYLYRHGSRIRYADLGTESYNYFNWDWYKKPKELGHAVWSEPYYDKGGGDTLMVTYSVPFYREIEGKKQFAGVATADLSLSWLDETVSSLKIGRTGYGFLISKEGKLITHPDKSLVMKGSVVNMDAAKRGGALDIVGRARPEGGTGLVSATEPGTGEKIWIAYAPLPSTGWSLAAVFRKDELMRDLYSLNRALLLVGIAGLLFLAAVIILFANSITKPLKLLAQRTCNIAKGDMDFDIPGSDSGDEVGNLARAFCSMKTELVNYIERLTKTTQEKEKIESELKIASIIQLGTLPRMVPPYTGRREFEIFATMKPAKEVGGDFYDFYFIDDEHIAFTIGDVSGKGVPAAIYMAIAKTYIQAVAKVTKDPVEVLRRVNTELFCDNVSDLFVTVFFGILNIRTGQINYANAGHNPPMVIHKGRDPEFFEGNSGCVLGAFETVPMGGGKISFLPGDIIFMYTDGVTEAMNVKREEFLNERLKETLVRHKDDHINRMVEAVLTAVTDFSGGAAQADDITILVLGYFGENGNPRHEEEKS